MNTANINMEHELKIILSSPFLAKGLNVLSTSEFKYYFTIDMHWFEQKEIGKIIDLGINAGFVRILGEKGEKIELRFDPGGLEIPLGYKPQSYEKISSSAIKAPYRREADMEAKIVDYISNKTGINKDVVKSEVEVESERFENFLPCWIVALFMARKRGLEIGHFLP